LDYQRNSYQRASISLIKLAKVLQVLLDMQALIVIKVSNKEDVTTLRLWDT